MLKPVVTALLLLNLIGDWDEVQTVTSAPRTVKASFDHLERATSDARGKQEVKNDHLLVLLRPLLEASEHWTQKTESGRLLEWLNGKNPPPRCVAEKKGNPSMRCMNHSEKENSLCRIVHKCLSVSPGGCEAMRTDRTDFCRSHGCKGMSGIEPCASERLDNGLFCATHSCPCCINDINCISYQIKIEGHATCKTHRCRGTGRPSDIQQHTCNSSSLSPHIYCEEHLCVECGITDSVLNLPRAGGSVYCVQHKCSVAQCRDLRRGDFKYCTKHLCRMCEGDSVDPQPVDATAPNSHICSAHRCANDDCNNPRLFNTLDRFFAFCIEHTCRVCFLAGEDCDRPVTDEYPRNVCTDHPLCTHFAVEGWQCGALAIPPNLIKCLKHDVDLYPEYSSTEFIMGDGQCWGIAKKTKKRCKSTGRNPLGGQYWCAHHLEQAPMIAAPAAAPVEEDFEEMDEYDLMADSCQLSVPLPLGPIHGGIHR